MILRAGIIMEVKNNYFDSFKTSLRGGKDALFIWGDIMVKTMERRWFY